MAEAEQRYAAHLCNRCLITEALHRDGLRVVLYLVVPVLPTILGLALDHLSMSPPAFSTSWLGLSWYLSGMLYVAAAITAYRRYEGAIDFTGWLVAGSVVGIMGLSAAGRLGVTYAHQAALGLWAVVVIAWLWSTWAHHRSGTSRADRRWQSSSALLAMLLVSVLLLVTAYVAAVVLNDDVLHRACQMTSWVAVGITLLLALAWVHTPAAARIDTVSPRARVNDAAFEDARRAERHQRISIWAHHIGLGLRMLALWLVLGVMVLSATCPDGQLVTTCCYGVVGGLVVSFAALAVSAIYASMNGRQRRQSR